MDAFALSALTLKLIPDGSYKYLLSYDLFLSFEFNKKEGDLDDSYSFKYRSFHDACKKEEAALYFA